METKKRILAKDLTYEDCAKFMAEHKGIKRRELSNKYTLYYNAMILLGCYDELCPKADTTKYTINDCKAFMLEHVGISRYELQRKYVGYYNAMRRLKIIDELCPSYLEKYNLEHAIQIAKECKNITELYKRADWAVRVIKENHVENVVFSHFIKATSDTPRLIYAWEFPDKSVYIGLTCNLERRKHEHLREKDSAVYKHKQEVGLEPILKQLTEFLAVPEARNKEGEYVEIYRNNGWTILNRCKTGSIGTALKYRIDEQVLQLNKRGKSLVEIATILHVNKSTVIEATKRLPEYKPYKQIVTGTVIAKYDNVGNKIEEYKSILEASRAYKISVTAIHTKIKKGEFVIVK